MFLLITARSRVVSPDPAPPPGQPQIGLSTSSISGGTVEEGDTTPVTGSIDVTNTGTGALSGLAVSAVTYVQGASGWLTPTWDSGNSQADWTISPTGLTEDLYSATFQVTASNANAVTVTATLEVTAVAAPPGNFTAPDVSLPSFIAFGSSDDDLDGAPFTPSAIGYYD